MPSRTIRGRKFAKEELIKKLEVETERLQKQIAVEQEDLGYIQKLGGFTSTALTGLTEKGRLDSEAILALSRFVMESRARKSRNETDLRVQLQAASDRAEFARRSSPSCQQARAGSSVTR